MTQDTRYLSIDPAREWDAYCDRMDAIEPDPGAPPEPEEDGEALRARFLRELAVTVTLRPDAEAHWRKACAEAGVPYPLDIESAK